MRQQNLFDHVNRCVFLCVLLVGAFVGCSGQQSRQTLTIAFSNDLIGEIRSCGCVANDFGGLGRRATYVATARDTTENLLLVDAGDFFGREINYGKEKADITMKSMVLMGYHAVVLGENDFGFGVEFIVDRTAELDLPVIAANLRYEISNDLLFPPSKIVALPSGLKVGLIGVIDPKIKFPTQVASGTIKVTDMYEAINNELPALRDQVDLVVVLAHAGRKQAQAIGTRIPEVDLVVHGHQGRPLRRVRRFGNAYVLQVSEKGMYMGNAFAVLDESKKIRALDAVFIPLAKRFADHEAIARLFRSYDMSVAAKAKGKIPAAVFEARAGLATLYAGSEACKDCHEDVYTQWSATKHAHAFQILVDESRQYDRDCTPCHTTGFYKRGGFESLQVTPELINIGCESCHGNGHDHVADTGTATEGVSEQTCLFCHTKSQSPDFNFDASWERIRH